jgi:transposase
MDQRETRGLVIAATQKLERIHCDWLVPSQSDEFKQYRVNAGKETCTCADYRENMVVCKHIHAVKLTIQRELKDSPKETPVEAVAPKYSQDWKAYDRAQGREKDRVQAMLYDLCRMVPEPIYDGIGREPHKLRDRLYAMLFKVYSTLSSRRFGSDMRDAVDRGHMTKAIPPSKINYAMRDPRMTDILKELIVQSAAPLKCVNQDFAIDSSGFGSCKFDRWFDEKYGKERSKNRWVKVHIACGVKTHVVTAVRILGKDAPDSPQFAPLVRETRRHFEISEVSADKAYASLENFEAVANAGGTGFLAFKSNTTGSKGGLFEKMYHFFKFKQDEYLEHYHKRSNVESTFSMIKRKFGDSVRSKDDVSMVNEVLCKILCHNLCVLNQEECELGIDTSLARPVTKPLLRLAVA